MRRGILGFRMAKKPAAKGKSTIAQPAPKPVLTRWLPGLALIVAVVFIYQPAWNAGFIWDDDSWTSNLLSLFQNASGLWSIWFQPTAMQQYYPLSGTTFWLDYQCWRFWAPPYHLENILLHALAALLFWRFLRRLRLPGAWLAAALFAVHPIMVESTAWITERKNVLSQVFFLAALLAYDRFSPWARQAHPSGSGSKTAASPLTAADRPQSRVWFYFLALLLFLAAMLAKTSTFSLPAVILLLAWWKHGRIRWLADGLPTLPFFALAAGLCLVTAWVEKNHVMGLEPEFDLTFSQRCLVAGHVFWFYPCKLLWPANLNFAYPRWQPDPAVWWQWLYPLSAAGVLLTLWLARKRIGRGPAAALFFYVGTLFPVMGFLNTYGMRYSFVWDHWFYLPSLGLLAAVAATTMAVANRLRRPAAAYGFAAVVLPVLGILTWQRTHVYRDLKTLWDDNLAKNPDSLLARDNLGLYLAQTGQTDAAITCWQISLQIKPDDMEACCNLGTALLLNKQFDEAARYFQKALQIERNNTEALNGLGGICAQKKDYRQAVIFYCRAIQIKPDLARAHFNMGMAFANLHEWGLAIRSFRNALQINPNQASVDQVSAHAYLAAALFQEGKRREAVQECQAALQLNPHDPLAARLSQELK